MDFLSILFITTALSGIIYSYSILFPENIKKEKSYIIKNTISIFVSIFPILFAVLLVRSFIAEPFRIPSGSMKPTLLEGDFILVKKFSYSINLPIFNKPIISLGKPKNGDVIVFKHNKNINMVKRIIGIPGDKLLYNNKFVYLNKKIQKQYDIGGTTDTNINKLQLHVRHKKEVIKNIKHDIYHIVGLKNRNYTFNNIHIPKNKYFVMGDFRDNSQDSRIWGLVDEKFIIGKAFLIWMSWDSNNKDIRWRRLGKDIK